MKHIYTFLLLFISFSLLHGATLNLSQKERLWLQQHPTIKVSNEEDWAPFDFEKDGRAQGYSVDIVKALAKKIGLQVIFINGYSWQELLQEFDKGNIDMMQSMSKNRQRAAKYSFSKPYMHWQLSYFLLPNNTTIHSPKDFSGKRIAAGKGWASTNEIKRDYPDAKIIEYDTSLAMLKALSQGDVDVMIDNSYVVGYLMSENMISNIKEGGFIQLKDKDINNLYFVSHKDEPELASIFSKAYELLSVQEKLDLQAKWLSKIPNINEYIQKNNLSEVEKKYLQKKKVITMCIDPDWMPFEKFDKNGKHIGMTAEYFDYFSKYLHIPIKVYPTKSWSESIEAAKARKCDIFSLAMSTKERRKYMNFTPAYLSIPLVLATKLDVPFINDFKAIKNKKIGIVKGYAFNEIIRRKYPNIQVVDVKNITEGLQKVANGELFGFIGTLASIGYTVQKDFTGELKIAGKFPEKWELGIGVRNDDPLLFGIFSKAVQSIPLRLKQNILNKYIAIVYEQGTDYKLLTQVLIFFALIALIATFYYRKLTRVNKELQRLKDALQEQADHDPLTNLYNRRYFHNVADNIFNLSKRNQNALSVLILDIDFFKKVNDTYGHNVGDTVIKTLAEIMQKSTRKSDVVARFGGEEFVILLPNTDINGAKNIGLKIAQAIEATPIQAKGEKPFHVTVSVGAASVIPEDKSIDDTINRADMALYEAKNSGRNRVVSS